MTQITFTPGPWTYHPAPDGCDECWEIHAPFAELAIASVPYWPDEDGLASAEAEANAKLMAAAPKMLAALQAIQDAGYLEDGYGPTRELVLAAIELATKA